MATNFHDQTPVVQGVLRLTLTVLYAKRLEKGRFV
jgi:hypothetical protein